MPNDKNILTNDPDTLMDSINDAMDGLGDEPDTIEEEVVEDEIPGDNVPDVPDDADADEFDEEHEPEDDQQEDEAEEPDEQPATDPVVGQLAEQVQALTNGFNQMVQYLQNLPKDQAKTGKPVGAIDAPLDEAVPTEIEDYTQHEAVVYSLKQAKKLAQTEVNQIKQPIAAQFSIHSQIISKLIETHPKNAVITSAIQRMQKSPGASFEQCYAIEEGIRAKRENDSLKNKQRKIERQQIKRKMKATNQTRPNQGPPVKKGRVSVREATQDALNELLGRR